MCSEQHSGGGDEQDKLHRACNSGTLGDVLKCLQASSDNIQRYYEGQLAIHTAILSGRADVSEVITALLRYGADVNAQTISEGNTALHLAVLHGVYPRNFDIIKFLLNRKADASIRNKTLRTPYDCAMATEQYEVADVLNGLLSPPEAREAYKKRIGQKYGHCIIEAVLANKGERLKKYIELGGDPNTVNKHKAGAMHYAVTHSRLPVADTLSLLLHAGADPNLQNEEEDTPLNLAIKNPRLQENDQLATCVQLLVDAGADCNIPDWDGKNAVQLADDKGYSDVLKILKNKTSSVANESVNSPISFVILYTVQSLHHHYVRVISVGGHGSPPNTINRVMDQMCVPVSSTLCRQVIQDGNYPIHEAAIIEDTADRHRKIKALIAKGADVSKQNIPTGNTALHVCAMSDFGDTATLLLEHHVDYTVKNAAGKTAYDTAKELGHESVATAIQKKQESVHENWKEARKKTQLCMLL